MNPHPVDMASPEPRPEPPRQLRDDVVLRRRLTDDARTWAANGHADEFLYRGAELSRVEHRRWYLWRVEPDRFPPPDELERRFLEQARALSRRRGRSRPAALIAGLSVIVLALTLLHVHNGATIERERIERTVAQLVADSRDAALIDGRLSRNLAAAAWRLDPGDRAWSALALAVKSPATGRFDGPHTGGVQRVATSPDGAHLATGGGDGTVALWDADTGQPVLFDEALDFAVEALEFSPDGRTLAALSFSGPVLAWDVDTATVVSLAMSGGSGALAFDPHAAGIATAGDDGVLRVWGLGTGRLVQSQATGFAITQLAYTADGDLLLAASDTGRLSAFDTDTFEETVLMESDLGLEDLQRQGYGHPNYLVCEGFGACGLISDPAGPAPTVRAFHDSSAPARLTPKGDLVAATHSSGGIGLWQAGTGALTGVLPYPGTVDDLDFSPDGSQVYAAANGSLQRWEPALMHRFDQYPAGGLLRGAALADDDKRLIVTGLDATIEWDALGGGPALDIDADRPGVALATTADGALAATGVDAEHGIVEVWDPDTGDVLTTIETEGAPMTSLEFSPDGTLLAGGSGLAPHRSHPMSYGVTIWRAATGEEVATLDWDPALAVEALDFSDDGTRLVTVDDEGTVRLWDGADGSWNGIGAPTAGAGYDAAFHPAGVVLTFGINGEIDVRDRDGGLSGTLLPDFGYYRSGLDLSPDGGLLATYESFPEPQIQYELPQTRMLLVDTDRGVTAAALPMDGTFVYSVFSGDGRTLYVAHDDLVTVFDVGYLQDDLHRLACDGLTPMTRSEWSAFVPELPFGSVEVC